MWPQGHFSHRMMQKKCSEPTSSKQQGLVWSRLHSGPGLLMVCAPHAPSWARAAQWFLQGVTPQEPGISAGLWGTESGPLSRSCLSPCSLSGWPCSPVGNRNSLHHSWLTGADRKLQGIFTPEPWGRPSPFSHLPWVITVPGIAQTPWEGMNPCSWLDSSTGTWERGTVGGHHVINPVDGSA